MVSSADNNENKNNLKNKNKDNSRKESKWTEFCLLPAEGTNSVSRLPNDCPETHPELKDLRGSILYFRKLANISLTAEGNLTHESYNNGNQLYKYPFKDIGIDLPELHLGWLFQRSAWPYMGHSDNLMNKTNIFTPLKDLIVHNFIYEQLKNGEIIKTDCGFSFDRQLVLREELKSISFSTTALSIFARLSAAFFPLLSGNYKDSLVNFQDFFTVFQKSNSSLPTIPDGQYHAFIAFIHYFISMSLLLRRLLFILKNKPDDQNMVDSCLQELNREIVIERVETEKITNADLLRSEIEMKEFSMCHPRVKVEDVPDGITADFADQYIGGLTLRQGSAQEELLFTIHPECVISMFICPVMNNSESIRIKNVKRFSNYSGYSSKFKWKGPYQSIKENETVVIGAMDAQIFTHKNGNLNISSFLKDANKINSLLSSQFIHTKPISQFLVTGQWGCGVFKGDPELKFITQWLICSLNNYEMKYCPLNSFDTKMDEIISIKSFINNKKNKINFENYKNKIFKNENCVKVKHIFKFLEISLSASHVHLVQQKGALHCLDVWLRTGTIDVIC